MNVDPIGPPPVHVHVGYGPTGAAAEGEVCLDNAHDALVTLTAQMRHDTAAAGTGDGPWTGLSDADAARGITITHGATTYWTAPRPGPAGCDDGPRR